MSPTETVRAFWQSMRSNDWQAAAAHLAPDYRGLWPQTGEVMEGRAGFAAMQAAFPGQGGWQFEEIALLADGPRVVTDMRITHATLDLCARAITFHDTADGLITRQTEFWPDPYPVPDWRRGLAPVRPDLAPY